MGSHKLYNINHNANAYMKPLPPPSQQQPKPIEQEPTEAPG